MDAIEAIETCRAMRYLRPDPVPAELVRRVIQAASCASSPGNSQGWHFIAVTDRAQRQPIAQAIVEALRPVIPEVPEAGERSRRLMLGGLHHLLDHLDEVPVLIFVCGEAVYPPGAPEDVWIPPAVYPAAQNLIVAARSLGLGTVFTTFHGLAEKRIREVLRMPDRVRIAVTIPLGWPARRFGPLRRKPLEDVLHWERW